MSPEGVSLLDSERLRAGTRKSMSHVRVSPEGVSLLDSGRLRAGTRKSMSRVSCKSVTGRCVSFGKLKIESGYSEEHVSWL